MLTAPWFSPSQFLQPLWEIAMASTTKPARGASAPVPEPCSSGLSAIGVGIDTARYGHLVSFLRPDRQAAAKKLLVMENHGSYQALRERLEQLHQQHPQAHFHIRIDAAGQYANNLERFVRGLPLPMTLSIGEPKRNRDYQMAHFPKRQTDETESIAMARFAVVEEPTATNAVPEALAVLAEVAGRLQAQTKQATQIVNRLHNLLARVFPELASFANNFAAAWVLELLTKYPSAAKIGQARLASLTKIPYLPKAKAQDLHQAAQQSVGTLRGEVAETLVRELVDEVRHSQAAESKIRQLLIKTYAALPAGNHSHLESIKGIGAATAAVLIAKIIDINRFDTPDELVGYFGVFPEEHSSGVDKKGRPLPPGTMVMSPRGNDLVRAYLWMAALSGVRSNPALRALFRRLKAKGRRGDVALGHCMRKLLHLIFAIWKTGKPFDPKHYPWIQESDTPITETPVTETAVVQTSVVAPAMETPAAKIPALPSAGNTKAVGHKRDQVPAKQVVTTAPSSVKPAKASVNPLPSKAPTRPRVDYAYLRRQVTMEQVLEHLGILGDFKGTARQRRGPCPVHGKAPADTSPSKASCSVHLGKNIFQCFQPNCAAQGNVLDLWAAVQQLPLYDAALHLAATFHLPRNREEEPVLACKQPTAKPGSTGAVITTNGR
jgi:transposase